MSACEPCWNQAFVRSQCNGKGQVENYHDLLRENDGKPGHGPVYDDEFGIRIHPCEHASLTGLTCDMCGAICAPGGQP